MDEQVKKQIDETLKDSPVAQEPAPTPEQIMEEAGVQPYRSYIQEHKETIEVPGYEYPETKLDTPHEEPKSQFDNGTLPETQRGSFGKDYNFAPVKPYKVFLPTLQEEVMVTTTDPRKAAFELATQYRATDPSNFIGYRYVSNEDLAVELARQTSSMFSSSPTTLGIEEQPQFGEQDSWWADTLPVDFLKGIGSFLWETAGTTAKAITSTPWTGIANVMSWLDSDETPRELIYVETDDGRRYPQIKNPDSRADRLWNDAQRFSTSIDRVVGTDEEKFFTLKNPGIAGEIANGIGQAIGSVGLSVFNPVAGAALATALSYDNIRENALNAGYTYDEALKRAIKGSSLIFATSLISGVGANVIRNSAVKAYAESSLAKWLGRGAAALVESAGEVGEEWIEEVESGLAETTGYKQRLQKGLTRDDLIVGVSSFIVALAGYSLDARDAYVKNKDVSGLTDKQKQELADLSGKAKAFSDTMQKFGLSKEQADNAVIDMVRSGPEDVDAITARIQEEIKDRQNTEDVKAQLDEINKLFDVKNLQDMYQRGIEAVEANVDAKLAGNKKFTDQEKQVFKALFVPYAVQVSAITGIPIDKIPIPDLKTLNSYSTLGSSTYFGPDKPGVVKINKATLDNKLSHEHPSVFDPYSTRERKRDVIATMAHEMLHQYSNLAADLFPNKDWANYVGTGVKIISDVFDATPEQATKKAESLSEEYKLGKTDPDAAKKAAEVASTRPDVVRDTTQNGLTAGKYTDPTNFTEWYSQAISRAKSEIKTAFGLSEDNEAWAALAEVGRLLDGASNYIPLTNELKNFVEAYRAFVKQNSEAILKLVKSKGSRKLNKAIRAWLSGDPDAIDWNGITMEDIVELGKLADKPANAEAIDALSRSLAGVPLKDFRKKYAELHDQIERERFGEADQKKPETVDDIDDIDIDELVLDPFATVNEERMIGYQSSPTEQYDQPALVDKYGNSLIGSGEGGEAHMRGSYFLADKEWNKTQYFVRLGLEKREIPFEIEISYMAQDKDGDWDIKTVDIDRITTESLFGDDIYTALLDKNSHSWELLEEGVSITAEDVSNYLSDVELNRRASGVAREIDHVILDKLTNAANKYKLERERLNVIDPLLIDNITIRMSDIEKGQIMQALLPDQDLMFEEERPISQQNEPVKKAVLDIANELFFDKDGLSTDEATPVLDYYSVISIEDIKRMTAMRFWDMLEDYYIGIGAKDPGESAREILVKNGIEGNHYFGGRDGEGWVVFDTSKIEPQRVGRGTTEVINFEQVAGEYARNNLIAQLTGEKQQEETAFQKRINKTVGGRTLEEDFDYFEDMFMRTKTKRGVDAWLSERRGLDGYLFSLGGMDALRATQLPLKRQAFRDIYDSSMSRIREIIKKEMFGGSDLKYDQFLKDHLSKTIDAQIYDDTTKEVSTRKVSPDEVAYAILAFEQYEANGPMRVRKTWRNLDDVVKQLTPEQLKFVRMLRDDLKNILRDDLRAQDKYGDRVGRVLENYYPLVTQNAVSDDRPSTTLSFLSRKETESPIGVIGAVEVYGRYMGRIAGGKSKYFQEVQRLADMLDFKPSESLNDEDRQKATELESRSRKFRNIIRNKIGVDGLRYMEDYIRELKNGSATRDLANGSLYKASKSLTPSLLGGRLKNFFTNIWNAALAFGAPDIENYYEYTGEMAKAIANPVSALKETLQIGSYKTGKRGKDGKIVPGLGFFANRFANTAITEFTQRGATPTSDKVLNEFAMYLKKKNLSNMSDVAETVAWLATKADKLVMLPTTLGDLAGNFVTSAAMRRQYIKQNIRKGMSVEDATIAADDAVIDFVLHRQSSSNQAMKPLSVLRWNKQSVLMSTAAQFTGETTTKIGQIGMDIQGARMGEISTAQAARDILSILAAQLGYRLTQAGVWGGLASLAIGDLDDDEKEFIVENLANGIVQDIVDFAAGPASGWISPAVLYVLADKSYGLSSHPLISELAKLGASIKDIGVAAVTEKDIETDDVISAIGKGAAYGVGFPAIDTIVNDIRGAYEAVYGESESDRKKGRYMATGRSESFAKKAAGQK